MNNSLLCHIQSKINGVDINEKTKFLTGIQTDKDNSLVYNWLVIPLTLHGSKSFIHGRKPSPTKYDNVIDLR
jgi:hypothetical protein